MNSETVKTGPELLSAASHHVQQTAALLDLLAISARSGMTGDQILFAECVHVTAQVLSERLNTAVDDLELLIARWDAESGRE